jgi:hypothetical protein
MPVLDLTDLQDDPEVTRLKILALMLYPFDPSPYHLLLGNIHESATTYKYDFDQIEQREYCTLIRPPDYSHQSRWDIACQKYAGDQRGCTAGWLLLTAERLQTAGYHDDTVSEAAFLFKSL